MDTKILKDIAWLDRRRKAYERTAILKDIAWLDRRRKAYERTAEHLGKERAVIAEPVLDCMIEDGEISVKLTGGAAPLRELLAAEVAMLARNGGLWSMTTSDGRRVEDIVLALLGTVPESITVSPTEKCSVYVAEETWGKARDGDNDRLAEVLRGYTDESGLRPYEHIPKVQINHRTLQSVAIELKKRKEAGEEIPAPLANAIEISTVFRLKTR